MPTQITQSTNESGGVVLRVDGEMLLDDALLLERIAKELVFEQHGDIAVDLADLDFLDSESGAVLRRLRDELGVRIEGMEIFLQSAINSAERSR